MEGNSSNKVTNKKLSRNQRFLILVFVLILISVIGIIIDSNYSNVKRNNNNNNNFNPYTNSSINVEKQETAEFYFYGNDIPKQSVIKTFEQISEMTVKSKDIVDENKLYIKEKDKIYTVMELKEINSETEYYSLTVKEELYDLKATNIHKILYNFLEILGTDDKVDEDAFYDLIDNMMFSNDTLKTLMLPMVFDSTKSDKPVIYLYPTKKMDIDVRVNGVKFSTTYPEYNNGWSVTAYPDGTLVDKNDREYNYLYWEGYSDFNFNLSEGFIVEKKNYIEFLEEKLEYVGLTDKEAADFITYWLPQMNEYDYVQVYFAEEYEDMVKKNFNVEPDNQLNLFVVFKGLEEPIKIEEQDISFYKDFERKGFVVVEWGGTFLK